MNPWHPNAVSLEDLASGAVPVPHHALLLVGSRLPEEGLPAWAFHGIAAALCGIRVSGEPMGRATAKEPAAGTPARTGAANRAAKDALAEEEGADAAYWARAATHPDIVVVDREANVVKLEHVAPIRERSFYAPTQGRRRLFFIDRCERLPAPSANALLKVLEEPPAPCLFVFTARSLRNVLPTIASRCQRLAVAFPRDEAAAQRARALGPAGALVAVGLEEADARTLLRLASAGSGKPLPLFAAPAPGATALKETLETADTLARKYDAETLVEACLAAAAAAHRAGALPLEGLRFVKEDLRAWREAFAYNPSSSLWLARVLLRLAPG